MDLTKVKQIAEGHYQMNDHPALVIDLETISLNYRKFRAHFPQIEVHYAVKSLCDREVIKVLASEGSSFEVASLNELQTLAKILPPKELIRVFYSNPAKSKRSIMVALLAGIRWFCVDSLEEIRKICMVANTMQVPTHNLKLYLRLTAESKNSYWPLSKKYGANRPKAMDILNGLASLDCKLSGFTFHVGSQCMDHEAWGDALLEVDYMIEQATALDVIEYEVMVNIGGGFPSDVMQHNADSQTISRHIDSCLEKCTHWERMRLAAEPGRSISSTAGCLATKVILRTEKNGENWLYVDCGVFHGMNEPSYGVVGKTTTTFESPDIEKYVLAGPSCDSADVIPGTVVLPKQIAEDDIIFIQHSGSYSMSYATGDAHQRIPGFNGFFPPTVYYIHK